MSLRTVMVALLIALTAAAPAQAIAPDQRGEAFNRLEKKVMCIACNVPLNIAETAQADATRTQIRSLLGRGLSEQQVLDQLVEDYGENVLASPKAEGISTLAYVVPAGALVGLLALGALLLPRWKRSRSDHDGRGEAGRPDDENRGDGRAAGNAPSRAEHERLDAELTRYGT